MQQHRGEIIEAVVRRSGYSLKKLADKLNVSRNTLYNKFGERNLSYEFIVRTGEIIHYDFTYDFKEIKTTINVDENKHAANLWRLERKYTHLLERYNILLSFLVRIANDYQLDNLKKDLTKFLGDMQH